MTSPNRAKKLSLDSTIAHTVEPAGAVLSSVYPHLRRIARRLLSGERTHHTLQPTALANEAVARLLQRENEGVSERELISFGIREMQTILIDSGRRYRIRQRCNRDASPSCEDTSIEEVLHLQRCLEELGRIDPRAREIVELRFFGGMSIPEVAEFLGVSARTVNNDWEFARSWLARYWVQRSRPTDSR